MFIGALEMLAVLEAEEAIHTVGQIGIGTGSSDPQFRAQQMRAWHVAAGHQITPQPMKKVSADRLQKLAGMGMDLVKVPVRG